jgi:hypothetical protein
MASFYRQANDALPNIGGNYIAVTDCRPAGPDA